MKYFFTDLGACDICGCKIMAVESDAKKIEDVTDEEKTSAECQDYKMHDPKN